MAERCRFCSAKESGLKGGVANTARMYAEHGKRRPIVPCANCGQPFQRESNPTDRRPGTGRYCSRACLDDHRSVSRECGHCGTPFRIAKSALGGNTNSAGNYCSRPCYSLALAAAPYRGLKAEHQWRKLRDSVVEQHPHCDICGTAETLDVHHIEPWRVAHNDDRDNLVVLCKPHHFEVERQTRKLEAAGDPTPYTAARDFIQERRAAHVDKSSRMACVQC